MKLLLRISIVASLVALFYPPGAIIYDWQMHHVSNLRDVGGILVLGLWVGIPLVSFWFLVALYPFFQEDVPKNQALDDHLLKKKRTAQLGVSELFKMCYGIAGAIQLILGFYLLSTFYTENMGFSAVFSALTVFVASLLLNGVATFVFLFRLYEISTMKA